MNWLEGVTAGFDANIADRAASDCDDVLRGVEHDFLINFLADTAVQRVRAIDGDFRVALLRRLLLLRFFLVRLAGGLILNVETDELLNIFLRVLVEEDELLKLNVLLLRELLYPQLLHSLQNGLLALLLHQVLLEVDGLFHLGLVLEVGQLLDLLLVLDLLVGFLHLDLSLV